MKMLKKLPFGNIIDVVHFGRLLVQHRKQQKLTQKQVSQFAGVSQKFISELENGKASVEFGKTLKVAQYLGLNVSLKPRGLIE